jgi:predicted protein tyrosine phosphatase
MIVKINVLFVCGKNRWRSPTAEAVFTEFEELEVDSAGVDRDAEVPIGIEAIERSDIIFVMEKSHHRHISQKFQPWLKNKRIVCLDIPDRYTYMQPELIEILRQKVLPILKLDDR